MNWDSRLGDWGDILQNQHLLSGDFVLNSKRIFSVVNHADLKCVHPVLKYFFIVLLARTRSTERTAQIPLEGQMSVSDSVASLGLWINWVAVTLCTVFSHYFKSVQPSFRSSFEQGQHKQFPVFYLPKVYFLFQEITLTGKLSPG